MRYIRTKDGRIIDLDRIVYGNKVLYLNENEIEDTCWHWTDILKQADTLEDLIQVGDIVFYFDYHSQKEQCLYVNDLMFIKNLNITKLLIPVGDDYKCIAKATHTYLEIDGMKQVVKRGELKAL